MTSNLDMLTYIQDMGSWTVKGYPDSSVLVVNPSGDGRRFEKGPEVANYWIEEAVARGLVEWDAEEQTPADGSHAFVGSGSCGWADATHRNIRVTERGRRLIAGADRRCDQSCECSRKP